MAVDRVARWALAISAAWFYLVVILTLLNSALLLTGQFVDFLGGLYLTQYVDAAGLGLSAVEPEGAARPAFSQLLAFGFDLGACVLFALLGTLALRGRRQALVIGLIWYGVDSLLVLMAQQWAALAVHGVGLLAMSWGMVAPKRSR